MPYKDHEKQLEYVREWRRDPANRAKIREARRRYWQTGKYYMARRTRDLGKQRADAKEKLEQLHKENPWLTETP